MKRWRQPFVNQRCIQEIPKPPLLSIRLSPRFTGLSLIFLHTRGCAAIAAPPRAKGCRPVSRGFEFRSRLLAKIYKAPALLPSPRLKARGVNGGISLAACADRHQTQRHSTFKIQDSTSNISSAVTNRRMIYVGSAIFSCNLQTIVILADKRSRRHL